jgi:hypothetical protein
MMTGARAIVAMRGARFGIRVASGVLALMVIAAGGIAVWYRQAWNVWPGQGASGRVHWCGRGYESFGGPPADLAAHHLAGAGPSPCRGPSPAAWMVTPGMPEGKHQKNRLHLDLRTADMSTEVRRVLGPRCDPDNRSGCHRRRLAHSRRPRRRRLLRAAADRRSASRLLGGCQPGKGRFDCVKA